MNELNRNYWETRWEKGETGWDIGHASPPITEYFDQVPNKAARILIPGCGNAWEAEYLNQQGFTNVFVIDISQNALDEFAKRVPDFPKEHMICDDFFAHDQQYDYIVEQTFFCALEPEERTAYAEKTHALLSDGGKLVGVLFDRNFDGGPPFGGNEAEYRTYFASLFDVRIMAPCTNSIKPRLGSELFICLKKQALRSNT